MDLWHPHPARFQKSSPEKQWADLEGKSLTTRDELYWRHSNRTKHKGPIANNFAAISELAVILFDAWCAFRRR
jgi:hypothetical protein